MENLMPRTYAEARKLGYKDADKQYQRGYISRKTNLFEQPVLIAGGKRKGQLYILVPCFRTTRYCMRMYLKNPN